MSGQNFNQSLKHFCGNSNATGLFMKSNYPNDVYNRPINTDASKGILGTTLENIALVKNYEDSSKTTEMKDKKHENSIHNEFVDFIVRTALFHREIDRPTLMGSDNFKNIRENLEKFSTELLNAKMNDTTHVAKNLQDAIWNGAHEADKTKFVHQFTSAEVGINGDESYYNHINAVILFMALSFKNGTPAMYTDEKSLQTALDNLKSQKGTFPTTSGGNINNNADNSMDDVVKLLIGNCKDNGLFDTSQGAFGDLCTIMSKKQVSGKSVHEYIEEIEQKAGNTPQSSDIKTEIAKKLNEIIVNHAKKLLSLINFKQFYLQFHADAEKEIPASTKTRNDSYKTSAPDFVKDLLKRKLADLNVVSAKMRAGFESDIVNAIFDIIKNKLGTAVDATTSTDTGYRTLANNQYAKEVYDNVFLKWGDLNENARNFYRTHLEVFEKTGASGGVSIPIGWNRIDESRYPPTGSADKLRLNLVKTAPGSVDTMFGGTLPFVAGTDSLWYTNNAKSRVRADGAPSNVLKEIYKCVYLDNTCTIGSTTYNFPKQYNDVKGNVADFDINAMETIKNFIKTRKSSPAVPQPHGKPASFSDLVEDMVTGAVYHRNAKGELYTMQNGVEVPYDANNIRLDNCVGTRLIGDANKCSKFVRDCIINGDKNSLSNCLASLGNQSMFNVAKEEMSQVDPNVAVQILKTFGFSKVAKKNSSEPVHVQSFDSWKNTVLDKFQSNVKDTILKNSQLCNYLKGVVDFVNSNPVILNPDFKGNASVAQVKQLNDPYLRSLNKNRVWTNPRPGSQQERVMIGQMLTRGYAPHMAMVSSGMLTNPYSNVTYSHRGGSMAISPTELMTGGANAYEESTLRKINRDGFTSELIEMLMSSVMGDLKNAGISLDNADESRIADGLSKLKSTEKKLYSYYAMLRILTDLIAFFKASSCVPLDNEGSREISLNDVKGKREAIEFLTKNITEVKQCISNNIDGQNARCEELVKYYLKLVDSDGKSDNLNLNSL